MDNKEKASLLVNQLKGASTEFKSGFMQGAKIALDAECKGENLHLQYVNTSILSDYDSGMINDHGGGDKGWWMDYIRAEVDAANEHWRQQISVDE